MKASFEGFGVLNSTLILIGFSKLGRAYGSFA